MKPIGTVIINKNENNLQMIISYFPTNKEDGKRYDYLTCLFPLGFAPDLPLYFINDSDFDLVAHVGLETVDFDKFTDALNDYISNQPGSTKNKEEIDMSQFTEL